MNTLYKTIALNALAACFCCIGVGTLYAQTIAKKTHEVSVINNSTSEVYIMVERTINSMNWGPDSSYAVSRFCWGPLCYTPVTSESPYETVAACTPDQTFKAYYEIKDSIVISDTSSITYCFKEMNNPSVEKCVTFLVSINSPDIVHEDTIVFGTSGCPLVASVTSDSTSVFGACDGTASVSSTGGVWVYVYQWDDPSSQTNAIATNLCAGNYSVTVTDSAGTTTIGSVVVYEGPVPPSVENVISNEPSIHIYPNPAREWITVEYSLKDKSNDAWFVLRNMLGAVSLKMNLSGTSGKIKLPAGQFNPGVYFYSLIVDDVVSSINKLIIDN